MVRTLYGKMAAVLLGLFSLIGILYVLLTLFTTQIHMQEVHQKLNRTLAANLVSDKTLMIGGRVNDKALKEIFHMLMVINPSIEVYLLDPGGKLLAFSAPPGKVKRPSVSMDSITRFTNPGADLPILGDDPRDITRKKVFSAAPITVEGRVEGYLYVILGGEEYDSVAQMLQGSYILRLSTWAAVAGLLFALLAGLLIFNILTRRLRRLTSSVEAFKQGDFLDQTTLPHVMGSRQGDEIDRLGSTFNEMAERIHQMLLTLKKTDTLRRELVANVSHDLRTPLASLQGYLETLLLMDGKLSREEQRRYLEIACRHSERLGRLVSELFELARLDSHETRPQFEPFSLGELAQDVIQKYQLQAEKKNVRLETPYRKDLPFVWADIGLIERVLENLLDNAMRYTPEGGSITVDMDKQDKHLKVFISDTGRGIPQEELPYIFDRFYRVEKDNRTDGTGLGLPIAKQILTLHESSIEAASSPDKGTTFSFHLPLHQPSQT